MNVIAGRVGLGRITAREIVFVSDRDGGHGIRWIPRPPLPDCCTQLDFLEWVLDNYGLMVECIAQLHAQLSAATPYQPTQTPFFSSLLVLQRRV